MRYELSDYEWTAIKPMLPNKPRGVRRVNDRRVLNGIFWVLRSGAPWRDLPEVYGPRTTCYNRFVRWRRAGVWDQIMDALAAGHDAAVQMIDTSVVRVHQHGACVADNNHQDMGRSRGGLTSKIHAVVDTNGLPVHLALTPGEAHDNRLCSVLLSALLPQTMLLADRGYDADWIRELARQQGAWANIPPKRNRKDPICFSPYLYRARNLIERFFNKIKQCRRVATRYDKLAANYLAFVKLASIRVWLRANESALTTSPLHKSSCSTHPDKGWLAVPSCIAKQGINEGGCSLLKLLAAVADLASRLNVRFAPEAASRKSSKNDVCFSLRSGHPCQISHV